MEKESRFLVQKKIWWGKSKKGGSDQTQTMLALRANKGLNRNQKMLTNHVGSALEEAHLTTSIFTHLPSTEEDSESKRSSTRTNEKTSQRRCKR